MFDLRPSLTATSGWSSDKPEGIAVLPGGELFVVTNNDGVDGVGAFLSFCWLATGLSGERPPTGHRQAMSGT